MEPDARPSLDYRVVSPRYFETIGQRVVAGCAFEERDEPESQQVAVVNQAFARHDWGDAAPVGQRVSFGDDTTPPTRSSDDGDVAFEGQWLPPRSLPSAAREGQSERGHLLAVANQQDVADQHRVVPGLARIAGNRATSMNRSAVALTSASSPSSDSTSNRSWSGNRTSWPLPQRPPFHFRSPSARSMHARMRPSKPKAWPS